MGRKRQNMCPHLKKKEKKSVLCFVRARFVLWKKEKSNSKRRITEEKTYLEWIDVKDMAIRYIVRMIEIVNANEHAQKTEKEKERQKRWLVCAHAYFIVSLWEDTFSMLTNIVWFFEFSRDDSAIFLRLFRLIFAVYENSAFHTKNSATYDHKTINNKMNVRCYQLIRFLQFINPLHVI